jgi:murein L,D-transpeptidase YcbB/YkuD
MLPSTLRTCRGAVSVLAIGLALASVQPATTAVADTWSATAATALQSDIERFVADARRADAKAQADAIKAFYDNRDYQPLWYDGSRLSHRAQSLFAVLRRVDLQGLDPSQYGLPGLAQKADVGDPAARARMELKLTRTLIDYAGDLSAGSVRPSQTAPGMFRRPVRPDPRQILSEAGDAENFDNYLAGLQPTSRRYLQLKRALARYRALAAKGGWPEVTPGPTLKPGMKDPRVAEVRKRLMVTGDLKKTASDPNLFDDDLEAAVKRFQDRNGLTEDGAVGRNTIKAMNVLVGRRIRQIAINMERRRWMPNSLGKEYIWVNLADFYLKVVKDTHTIYTARLIVGKNFTRTPIFSSKLKYILINPRWNVPYSIASKEMLPKIKRDPDYLKRNKYELLGPDRNPVDPGSVDWSDVSARNFRYFIRQKPGRSNALGEVAFMFPNKFNVFIHDTNARALFGRTVRAFSHGCMRLQYPLKLAVLLLKDKKGWNMDRIRRVIETRKPTSVYLTTPIPVHVTYITAWADKDGTVNFRRDIYKRDAALIKALGRTASR